jgi:predicted acylesterase/phospholipase RssA
MLTEKEKKYYSRLEKLSFDTLVVSSGGMNGLIILGALNYLQCIGKLKEIKKYIGCSAGSIISLLLIIGYTPFEISQHVIDTNMEKEMRVFDIKNLTTNFSFYSHKILLNIFDKLVTEKLGFIPTMKELHEMYNINWDVTTYNYSKMNIEYINHENTPNELCTVVACASCAIPVVFNYVNINEQKYIDGGILEPFPISFVKQKYKDSKILGVVLLDRNEEDKELNLLKFISSIIFIAMSHKKQKIYNKYIEDENVCILNLSHDNKGLAFHLDCTEKIKMFAEGDVQVRKKLRKIKEMKEESIQSTL